MAKSNSVIGGFQKTVKKKSFDYEEDRKDKKDRLKSIRRSRTASRSRVEPSRDTTDYSDSQGDYDEY